MFIDVLNKMLLDLKSHNRDKNYLLEFYIQKRLSNSLSEYYKSIAYDEDYLSRLDSIKVMKKMNKVYK